MKLNAGSLHLVHVPARYSFSLDLKGEIPIAERGQLQSIQIILAQYPQLRADVELPRFAANKQADKLRTTLCDVAPLLGDPARAAIASNQSQDRTAKITLKPEVTAADKDPLN